MILDMICDLHLSVEVCAYTECLECADAFSEKIPIFSPRIEVGVR